MRYPSQDKHENSRNHNILWSSENRFHRYMEEGHKLGNANEEVNTDYGIYRWMPNSCHGFMMIGKRNIVERGLEFFYVADKYVKFDGKEIIPTFKNFRTLESMLAKFEPDELEEIKTGVHKYKEARTAFFDVED